MQFEVEEPQVTRAKEFKRGHCEEHNKMLFRDRRDAVGSLQGSLRSKRIRVYPCEQHKGFFHLTKESRKYRV